jgi:hypothetical protein
MNVRVCGRFKKQDLIEGMLTENEFYVCALSETKLKGIVVSLWLAALKVSHL